MASREGAEINLLIEKHESNARAYSRKWDETFVRAKGSILTDATGREFIDFFCGAGVMNYGHNHPALVGALEDYLATGQLIHGLDMFTPAKEHFVYTLVEQILKPRGLEYKLLFTGPTGTDAVESACKIARKATGRQTCWSFAGGFHGITAGSLSLTGDKAYRNGFGRLLGCDYHLPRLDILGEEGLVALIKYLISDDQSGVEKPAAIIMETTQIEGGINVFPVSFLRSIESICRDNGILFIIDDIQMGCWRSGDFFSFERASVKPDIVCLSKALSGSGLPLALVLVAPEHDCLTPAEHCGTFRGNQLAMASAAAAIRLSEEKSFSEALERNVFHLAKWVEEISENSDFDVRGIGMAWGLDMKSGRLAACVARLIHDMGVIVETCGKNRSVVKIMPAVNIDADLLDKGLSIVGRALRISLMKHHLE